MTEDLRSLDLIDITIRLRQWRAARLKTLALSPWESSLGAAFCFKRYDLDEVRRHVWAVKSNSERNDVRSFCAEIEPQLGSTACAQSRHDQQWTGLIMSHAWGSCKLMAVLAATVLAAPSWAAEIDGPIEDMVVDAAIVLAIDVSSSIDVDQAKQQRQGHADALRSREVKTAISDGFVGCIAVTYVEWSSVGMLRTVLPWTRLCDGDDTDAAAGEILRRGDDGSERRGRGRTSLSFALDASGLLLDRFPGEAIRKIVDVSSNGTNNDGLAVADSRDRVLHKGYIVNGIVLARAEPGLTADLPEYFRRSVIGGTHSFVVVPDGPADYATALRRKLVLEISEIDRSEKAGSLLVALGEDGLQPGQAAGQANYQEETAWRN